MSSYSIKGDIRAFQRALGAVKTATKKNEAEIVNKALKDVAFRAMQFSEYADPGKIQAELFRDNIAIKIATKWLKKKEGTPTGKLTKRGKIKKHGAATRAKIAKAAEKLIRIRISRSKAVRAGWIPAVKAFGGSIRGTRVKAGGSATMGGAIKATIGRLSGLISNALVTRNHAGKETPVEDIPMAVAALQKAIRFVTQDRLGYALKKIEATLRKHSDK